MKPVSLQTILLFGALVGVPVLGWFFWSGESEETGSLPLVDAVSSDRQESVERKLAPDTAYSDDEQAVFECLVVLRDQKSEDEERDRQEGLKRGDVIAVRKAPQEWSATEKASYLIVPITMIGKEANTLLQQKKENDVIVQARRRYIDLEKIGFTDNQISGKQPFVEKTFDTSIVRDK